MSGMSDVARQAMVYALRVAADDTDGTPVPRRGLAWKDGYRTALQDVSAYLRDAADRLAAPDNPPADAPAVGDDR